MLKLKKREFKPIYFYTKDLHEAKALTAKIRIASLDQPKIVSDLVRLTTRLVINTQAFGRLWDIHVKVVEKRQLHTISFQLMGMNLTEVAHSMALNRHKLIKIWNNLIQRREKKPILRSTLEHGKVRKPALEHRTGFYMSCLLEEYV